MCESFLSVPGVTFLCSNNSFNSAMLVGFNSWAALFRCFHNISIGLRCGLGLRHSKTFFYCSHCLGDWLVCSGSLSAWPTLCWASVYVQIPWHCPVEFAGSIQSSLLRQWLRAALVPRQQSSPKPWCCHHWASQLGWGSEAGMQRLVSAKHDASHLNQKVLVRPQNILPRAFLVIHVAFSKL